MQQPPKPELTAIHRLKTGALIRASVLLGAMSQLQAQHQTQVSSRTAATATATVPENLYRPVPSQTAQETLNRLSHYADCIGLAFQIQDDILDETGTTATLGKPQGSDRKADKPTYVTVLGLAAAQDRANQLVSDAVAALAGLDSKADYLRQLASYIVTRRH